MDFFGKREYLKTDENKKIKGVCNFLTLLKTTIIAKDWMVWKKLRKRKP